MIIWTLLFRTDAHFTRDDQAAVLSDAYDGSLLRRRHGPMVSRARIEIRRRHGPIVSRARREIRRRHGPIVSRARREIRRRINTHYDEIHQV